MRTLVNVVVSVAVVALVAGAIAVIYKYTNGFNETFKTFYVEYDGEKILTTDVKQEFEPNVEYRYDVKYTFEQSDAKPLDYNVRIIPHAACDFDFTADDRIYKYSKAKELTTAFDVDKHETYFTLVFTQEQTLTKVLGSVYGTDRIILPSDLDDKCPMPYTLVVSSYNDSVRFNIRFRIAGVSNNGKDVTGGFEIDGITLDPDGIVFDSAFITGYGLRLSRWLGHVGGSTFPSQLQVEMLQSLHNIKVSYKPSDVQHLVAVCRATTLSQDMRKANDKR